MTCIRNGRGDAEGLVRQKWRLLKATTGERARRLSCCRGLAHYGNSGLAALARAMGMAISAVGVVVAEALLEVSSSCKHGVVE